MFTNGIMIPCDFSSMTSQCFQQQLLMLNMDWLAVLGSTHQNTGKKKNEIGYILTRNTSLNWPVTLFLGIECDTS